MVRDELQYLGILELPHHEDYSCIKLWPEEMRSTVSKDIGPSTKTSKRIFNSYVFTGIHTF